MNIPTDMHGKCAATQAPKAVSSLNSDLDMIGARLCAAEENLRSTFQSLQRELNVMNPPNPVSCGEEKDHEGDTVIGRVQRLMRVAQRIEDVARALSRVA